MVHPQTVTLWQTYKKPSTTLVCATTSDERMRRRLSSGRMHLGESDDALRSARSWIGTIAMSPTRSRGGRRREDESDRTDHRQPDAELGRTR
jgi:hypothetical protein